MFLKRLQDRPITLYSAAWGNINPTITPLNGTHGAANLIDNSTTPPARQPNIGHYGRLRKAYLEGYRPDLYIALVAGEKLYEHCAGIEEAALHRLHLIMPDLARRAGATRELQEKAPEKSPYCVTWGRKEIAKGRFSFCLTAPYSEERRRAASKAAKAHSNNLLHPSPKV